MHQLIRPHGIKHSNPFKMDGIALSKPVTAIFQGGLIKFDKNDALS